MSLSHCVNLCELQKYDKDVLDASGAGNNWAKDYDCRWEIIIHIELLLHSVLIHHILIIQYIMDHVILQRISKSQNGACGSMQIYN